MSFFDRLRRKKKDVNEKKVTPQAELGRKDWLDKGDKYKEEGQFDQAIDCFDQVIRTDQDPNGWAHYLKGTCLMELGRNEEAVECFTSALKLDPEGDTYRFDLGRALYALGRRTEARAAFQPLAKQSMVFGLDRKARDWLEKLNLEEGIPTKKPQLDTEVARAMAMIPSVDPRTDTKESALFLAADRGITEAVDILLRAGVNPRWKAPSGYTPLLQAAKKGHPEIVKALLEKGADPNDQNVFAAHTPLILAAMGNHVEVVRILIEAGADVNRRNEWGRTALSHSGRPEIRAMLVEAGAKD